jgi:hypothetical protein
MELSRSRKFFNLSGSGNAPHVWEAAVRQQIARVHAARTDLNAYRYTPPHPGPIEPLVRIEYEIHFLLVAIRNAVRSAEALAKLVGPGELADAVAKFKRDFPHADDFRDYVTHFTEYALGEGKHQRKGIVPAGGTPWPAWWGENKELKVYFGDRTMDLDDAATAAIELAQIANRSWLEGFTEAMWADANAAEAAQIDDPG